MASANEPGRGAGASRGGLSRRGALLAATLPVIAAAATPSAWGQGGGEGVLVAGPSVAFGRYP